MGSRRGREGDLRPPAPDARRVEPPGETDPTTPRRWDWTAFALLGLLAVTLLTLVAWASHDLSARRFFDERAGFENLRLLIVEGRLRPATAYYPSLSYLPYTPFLAASEELYRRTGEEAFKIFDSRNPRWVSETGYLVARLVSVIAGASSLVLTYLLGRRLFNPPVALLAAALASVTWGMVLVSIKLKPDILVVLLTLVAFWWSLDALEKPAVRRFALAGLGIGLAASAKYFSGATAAVPLALGALALGGRRAAQWGRLALAGGTAVVTFALLNPWPDLVIDFVIFQHRGYARKGAVRGMTHWDMVRREAEWLLQEHGALVLAFLVVGGLALAARAAGWRGGPPSRLGALALLAMILGHLLFFAAATTHFAFWNFVPLIPFTAITAAWGMVAVSERAMRPLPAIARGVGRGLIWLPAAALVLGVHLSRAHEIAVPTTQAVVARQLQELDATRTRLVYQEGAEAGQLDSKDDRELRTVRVERADSVPREALARADAVVFPAARLEGAERAGYARLLDSWPGTVRRVEPRWLSAQGPALVVATNEWHSEGEPLRGELEVRERSIRMPLPEPLPRGEVVSIALLARSRGRPWFPTSLEVKGVGETALHGPGDRRRERWLVTPRLRLRRGIEYLDLELPESAFPIEPLTVELYRWRRGPA